MTQANLCKPTHPVEEMQDSVKATFHCLHALYFAQMKFKTKLRCKYQVAYLFYITFYITCLLLFTANRQLLPVLFQIF